MRNVKLGTVVAIAVAVLLGSGCNPDKNKLFFKPEQGAKRTVDTESAINFSMDLMGMKMGFGSSTEATFDLTTQSVDAAGIATIDVGIVSYRTEITGLDAMLGGAMPGGAMPGGGQIPGMGAGDDPFGMKAMKTAFKAVEGEHFSVTVNKLGEITGVTGADALGAKAAAAFKAPEGMPKGAVSGDMFKMALGDTTMKSTLESVFVARPDKKLNAGDTWQGQSSGGSAMMQARSDVTYTVKERAGGSVNVDTAAKLSFEPQAEMVEQMKKMPGLKIEISGQGAGTQSFDEATGWLTDSLVSGTIPGNISAQIPQMGNMSIPVEVSYKTSVKTFPA
ncbi:MAG: hypothetical protein FJY92_02805 [Candidatus Hydrogenedentes bacterium]|nr:hypothetical protein [Candidatus Hydrogenedentota bacterium]